MEGSLTDAWDAEIRRFLAELDEAWARLDFEAVAAAWDGDDVAPVYMGDEYRDPVIGWPDLNRHWGRLGARLHAARIVSTPALIKPLASDLAVVVARVQWELVAVESDVRHTGRSWLTLLVRHRENGWQICHSMETAAYGPDDETETAAN